ncbi:MAG: hypothetical protein STHCBS139747_001686 [Sporothrix thermara]
MITALLLPLDNIVSTTAGYNIAACLYTSLGILPPGTTTDPTVVQIECPTSTENTCAINLPDSCRNLAGQIGIGVLIDVVLCTADLGVFAVGNVASCLATDVITTSTQGNGILGCITSALDDQCPATLPSACTKLSEDTGIVAITADIALCTVALGPYAAGAALTCLGTSGLTPESTGGGIVDCLGTALNIIV